MAASGKALPDNGAADFISAATLKWSTWLLLAYFGLRLVYLALNVASFVPPDEVTHAGLCKVFSDVLLLPPNSPDSYEFGLVTNTPWLYYWSMGKLLHLNFFGISELVFLRLLNIPLAFVTIFFLRRTLALLTDNRLSQLLLVVAATNTPMFSFLSASVSYDNLSNLLAAAACYYLLAFFKLRSGTLLAASLLVQLAGCLTKINFLPLVLVLNGLLVVNECRNLPQFASSLRGFFQGPALRTWCAVLLILAGFGLNLTLYGGNYLHYRTLTPAMSDVLSPSLALQNRIGARETIFKQYTEGKIDYMKALELTGEIRHPGDKSDTFYLLMNYENLKANPALWMGPIPYARVWFEAMTATVFGIKGHLPMLKDPQYLIPLYALMALSVLGFAVRARPGEAGWLPCYLAVIALFYAAVLIYKVNYSSYLYYGTPGPTLQGRYIFPVLGPIYVLSSYCLVRLFRARHLRLTLALSSALLLVCYDFPWFLAHATPEWFDWLPR